MPQAAENPKVLLVDDEPEFRQALSRRLERRGFEVSQAGSGAEAMQALSASPVDVVVADVKMPGMDGMELLRHVEEEHAGTEVILLTGQASVEDGVAGLKAGAFDYLTKPVEADQLAGKLRQAMELVRGRRQMEQEADFRKQMAERLAAAERLASLGTLATGVAHEINNPLAIIQESAGWLAGKLAKDANLSEDTRRAAELALEKINAGVNRVRRITHQLLELAKKNQWDVVRELDAAEVLAEAVELVRPAAEARTVALEAHTNSGGPTIWADPETLRQILLNLLTNAVQASPAGARVTAEVAEEGGEALYTVKDQGPGIPRDSQRRIFEPFYTTKPPGQGAGLGLSVCQSLASRMSGRLEVDSKVGAGAAFRLILPLRPQECEQVAAVKDNHNGAEVETG